LDRARKLGVGRVISAEERDRTEMESRVASASREHAQLEALATLAAARQKLAQCQTARQKLQDCTLCAPCPSPSRLPPGVRDPKSVRSVVAARKVAEGEMVRTIQSTVLFRLVIDQPLKLVATIPERFLGEVKHKQPVTLSVEAYPGET